MSTRNYSEEWDNILPVILECERGVYRKGAIVPSAPDEECKKAARLVRKIRGKMTRPYGYRNWFYL